MNLTITGKKIRIKNDLYCLNDLHKASGGEKKNVPNEWLRLKQTNDLVQELTATGITVPVEIVKGRGQGTYVCKELVYSYAMWISPKFNLEVIRAYDALVTGRIQEAERKATRDTARIEAPFMTKAVQITRANQGKESKHFHFSNEFDLINRVALGMTAKQYRAHHGIEPGVHIRDTLTKLEIEWIEHLQRANTTMIEIGFPFEKRKNELSKLYVQRHAAGLANEVQLLES